jgi:hypothetical protein
MLASGGVPSGASNQGPGNSVGDRGDIAGQWVKVRKPGLDSCTFRQVIIVQEPGYRQRQVPMDRVATGCLAPKFLMDQGGCLVWRDPLVDEPQGEIAHGARVERTFPPPSEVARPDLRRIQISAFDKTFCDSHGHLSGASDAVARGQADKHTGATISRF